MARCIPIILSACAFLGGCSAIGDSSSEPKEFAEIRSIAKQDRMRAAAKAVDVISRIYPNGCQVSRGGWQECSDLESFITMNGSDEHINKIDSNSRGRESYLRLSAYIRTLITKANPHRLSNEYINDEKIAGPLIESKDYEALLKMLQYTATEPEIFYPYSAVIYLRRFEARYPDLAKKTGGIDNFAPQNYGTNQLSSSMRTTSPPHQMNMPVQSNSAVAASNCPKDLSSVRHLFPSYSDPQLKTLVDAFTSVNLLADYRSKLSKGSPAQIVEANREQVQAYQNAMKAARECRDATMTNPAAYDGLERGALGRDANSVCAKAYGTAYIGYIGSRETANVMACYLQQRIQ